LASTNYTKYSSSVRAVPNAVHHTNDLTSVTSVSVGIDLGTTNSVAAIIGKDARPVLVHLSGDEWKLPSAVAYRPDGTSIVGAAALRYAAKEPHYAFHSFKRFIGRRYAEVEKARPQDTE
jgi:molecular chaperone DnaK (HSP70)